MVRREVEERGAIAKRLRAAREQLGSSIEHAAADAGVPLRYARLLEGEKPSGVGVSDDLYLIPFFRRYAAALGLPAEELLPDFLGQVQELPPPSPVRLAARRRRSRASLLRPIAVVIAIAAAVVVIMRQAPERAGLDDEHWGGSESERSAAGEDTLLATVESTPNPSAPEHDVDARDRNVATAPASAPAGVGSPAPAFVAEPPPAAAVGTPQGLPQIAGGAAGGAAALPPAEAATAQPTVEQRAATRATAPELMAAGGSHAPASLPAGSPAPGATPAEAAAAPALGGRELRIVAAEQTWLSLAVDDEPKHSILLQPGETRSWTATRAFTLTIGNAGGITVSLDGRELPPLGRSGQVVRNLRLPQDATTPG